MKRILHPCKAPAHPHVYYAMVIAAIDMVVFVCTHVLFMLLTQGQMLSLGKRVNSIAQ